MACCSISRIVLACALSRTPPRFPSIGEGVGPLFCGALDGVGSRSERSPGSKGDSYSCAAGVSAGASSAASMGAVSDGRPLRRDLNEARCADWKGEHRMLLIAAAIARLGSQVEFHIPSQYHDHPGCPPMSATGRARRRGAQLEHGNDPDRVCRQTPPAFRCPCYRASASAAAASCCPCGERRD